MNQNSVNTIGIKDESRKDSYLVSVNQADGLKAVSYTHLTLPTIYSV